MAFLSPLLLSLGAVLAVPLILHLLHRHQGPRILFPALRYLRRAERENARRIKLRQLLLMALRLAALAFLILAAARPFLRRSGTGHEPTAVAIVLDNSLSSGLILDGERVLDQLKARALETIGQARAEDRFWVIRAGAPWEPATMSNAAAAAERVSSTEVSTGSADLDASLARARALLAAGAGDRAPEIHLLSDLQANSFGETGVDAAGSRADIPLIVWAPSDPVPENYGISSISINGGLPPRPGQPATLAISVSGTDREEGVPMRLIIGERTAAAGTATPNATSVLRVNTPSSGFLMGHLELDPDALRGDDRRYFVAKVEPPPSIVLAGEPPFITDATNILAEAGRLRLVDSGQSDLLIAPGGVGLEGVRDGTTAIVLAPTSPIELPAVNLRLAEAGIPWQFGPPAGTGEARLGAAELEDELLSPLVDERLREVYALNPEGEQRSTVRLQLEDGRPWVVQGEREGEGGYILIASPLSNNATTIPTSSALLPLLDRLTGDWAGSATTAREARPGSRWTIREGADIVLRPDGVRDRVTPGSEYMVPGRAGIYQVLAGDDLVDAFAVNPDPAESDLIRLDRESLRTALGGWRHELVRNPESWPREIYRERLGREVWRPLLMIALALLLIEGLVAAAGSGRESHGKGSTGVGRGEMERRVPLHATSGGGGAEEMN